MTLHSWLRVIRLNRQFVIIVLLMMCKPLAEFGWVVLQFSRNDLLQLVLQRTRTYSSLKYSTHAIIFEGRQLQLVIQLSKGCWSSFWSSFTLPDVDPLQPIQLSSHNLICCKQCISSEIWKNAGSNLVSSMLAGLSVNGSACIKHRRAPFFVMQFTGTAIRTYQHEAQQP